MCVNVNQREGRRGRTEISQRQKKETWGRDLFSSPLPFHQFLEKKEKRLRRTGMRTTRIWEEKGFGTKSNRSKGKRVVESELEEEGCHSRLDDGKLLLLLLSVPLLCVLCCSPSPSSSANKWCEQRTFLSLTHTACTPFRNPSSIQCSLLSYDLWNIYPCLSSELLLQPLLLLRGYISHRYSNWPDSYSWLPSSLLSLCFFPSPFHFVPAHWTETFSVASNSRNPRLRNNNKERSDDVIGLCSLFPHLNVCRLRVNQFADHFSQLVCIW